MGIKNISVISIPVSDQQAAKTFYSEVLGFELLDDMIIGPDQRWVQLAPAGSDASITLVTWFPNMRPGDISGLVMQVDNIAETCAELQSRGLEISPIDSKPWGQFATFSDPDGNGWVLREAPPR